MKGAWNWTWKAGSILLLGYVILRGFGTPLQPGLVTATPSQLGIGTDTIILAAAGQPFAAADDVPSDFHVVLRAGDQLLKTETVEITPHSVRLAVNTPATLPSRALDAFVFTPAAGTLFLGNACFVEEAAKGDIPKDFRAKAPEERAPKLGFSFPYQPNIIESIRNLLWHVPMWFAMFFIMGLGFVASLAQLRTDNINWDMRAEAAVKTGLVFGLLGLATGSLWARWTWGAWWVSDPQLNGALVTVLLYSGYLILRAAMGDDDRVGRLAAVYNVFAFIMLVVLLMVLPRYTESLHPGKDGNPGFNSYDLDNSLRAVFYPAVIGWGALCYWMYTLRLRMNRHAYHLLSR
ncbi:MAG: cytochrome c biogenesis protein [Flavobacteriales bacterium]|nr:cytochrome c biogenesis protein [Flavobacteriales bacterium]